MLFFLTITTADTAFALLFVFFFVLMSLWLLRFNEYEPPVITPDPRNIEFLGWLYDRYADEYQEHWSIETRMKYARIQFSLEQGVYPHRLLKERDHEKTHQTDTTTIQTQATPETQTEWRYVANTQA